MTQRSQEEGLSPGSGVFLLRLHVVIVSAGIFFTYSGFLSLAKDVTLGVTGEGWGVFQIKCDI